MKTVYICSKYGGNKAKNLLMANIYCRTAWEMGVMPLAPHIIFTQFLDDENKTERKAGIAMGLILMKKCDEVWVCGLDISEGMKQEIDYAKKLKKKIRHFNCDMEETDGRYIR